MEYGDIRMSEKWKNGQMEEVKEETFSKRIFFNLSSTQNIVV